MNGLVICTTGDGRASITKATNMTGTLAMLQQIPKVLSL